MAWMDIAVPLAGAGGFVVCCLVLVTTAVLLHIRRKQVHRNQPLSAAVHQYLSIKAIYILGCILRRRLKTSTQKVAETQKSFLLHQLRTNAGTEYGKTYGFGNIRTVEEFIQSHPLTNYQHYAPYIDRMLKGERNVLTKEDPVVFGVSAGTSGAGCKTIPTLKHQRLQFFLHAVSVLYCCLLDAFPQVGSRLRKSMKIFYNPTKWRMSESGIRIGPSSSTPATMKGLLHMYSTPAAGFEIVSEPEALYVHLLFALKDQHLGLIEGNFASVIYNALKTLEKEIPNLTQDISQGKLNKKLNIPSDIRLELEKLLQPDPERADEISKAFESGCEGVCQRLWPDLNAVLCADSGAFTPYAEALRKTFCKGVPVYSPVYASTEGLIGVNMWPDQLPSRYLLHPGVHFFEFIPVEHSGEEQPRTVLLHQVEIGQEYEVVLTNVSGLCRYRLGDVVRVTSFYNQCPVIEFMYRVGQFLNVRGEKTSESLFYETLSDTISQWSGVRLVDYCCAESILVENTSIAHEGKPCYHVFLELEYTDRQGPVHLSQSEKQMLDDSLREKSFVYRSFRNKGSIDAMQVRLLQSGTFQQLRDHVISSSDTSSGQYKVPRVLKNKDCLAFLIEKLSEQDK